MSLLNVLVELKKCCNHPFLFESAEDDYRGGEHDRWAGGRGRAGALVGRMQTKTAALHACGRMHERTADANATGPPLTV